MPKSSQLGCNCPSGVQKLWKSIHEAVLGRFGAILAASWRSLDHLGSKFGGLGPILAPRWGFWGPSWLPNGAPNPPKSVPRAIWNAIFFIIDLKINFWSDLERTWPHLGPQNPPKMRPSWLQNRIKFGCWFESCFVMDFGQMFIVFWCPNMAWPTSYIRRQYFLFVYSFLIFWLLGSWVDFGVDFW